MPILKFAKKLMHDNAAMPDDINVYYAAMQDYEKEARLDDIDWD